MTYDNRETIEEYYPSIRPQTPEPEVDEGVLTTHLNARNNPHVVTAEQVDTYTKQVIDSKITTATNLNKQALDEAVHNASGYAESAQMNAERVSAGILGVQQSANQAAKSAILAQTMRDAATTSANEAKASEAKAKEYAEQAASGGGGGGDIDLTGYVKKTDVEPAVIATSTNPVQSKAVSDALGKKVDKTSFSYVLRPDDSPDVGMTFGDEFQNANAIGYITDETKNGRHVGFAIKEGTLKWTDNSGAVHTETLGGGGDTTIEVWKGNVGFGEQDTFFAAKKTADGDGQIQNGYPRLHNHGQDIHEVSGFSRDSRDDEGVWSHRLLLPWDLAKANDTSYLMAGVVWDSPRLGFNGANTKFVQPLLPENTDAGKALGLPYALPCFENSPVYWNGNIIWNDSGMLESGVPAEVSKAVIIPWSRVTGTALAPSELALKSDLEGLGGASGYEFNNLPSGTPVLESGKVNIFDASQESDGISVEILASTDGKVRDFLFVMKNANVNQMFDFPKGITILPRDGDDDNLVPEDGTNVFMFTEIMPNTFMVSRTKVVEASTEVTE